MTMYWTDPETARTIVDIAASLSKLADGMSSDEPMTANYSHTQPTLNSLEEVLAAVEQVQAKITDLPGHPGDYLRAMLKSFGTLARYMGDENYNYKDAVRDILEVELKEIPQENFDRLAQRIDAKLTEWGYTGTPYEKIAKWQDDKRIPADQVIATAERFLDKSRIYASKRVRKLPEGEGIDSVNPIQGVYWSGLSEYIGDYQGRLTFNIDRPWNVPTFACILTHEGYPGHHTYYTLWDYLYREGKLPMEAAYVLINSPINCLFEGAPEVAIHFLGWDDPREDTPEITAQEKEEIMVAKDIMDLQRMYQTNANYYYNAEGWSKEKVIEYMLSTGWYSEIEANNTFRYFSNRYKAIYYPCYYYGRWIIQAGYEAFPKERREEYFHIIYDIPQTNSTLIKAVREATGKSDFDPFQGI
ncbi:hypothetical protein [Lawsonibacter celer]|jgi:hypothetical protein|uniref:hypothetical protein n=1 Tax=Lawsonibacter celer TaxID=2986526 RepID=UPI001646535E|nr:hypothetical protein [Lawsonibacter celer]